MVDYQVTTGQTISVHGGGFAWGLLFGLAMGLLLWGGVVFC